MTKAKAATRFYRITPTVEINGTKVSRVIEASTAAQALRHAVAGLFAIAVSGPKDIVEFMRAGGEIEKAQADPLTGDLLEEPTTSGITVPEGADAIEQIKGGLLTLGKTIAEWNALDDSARAAFYDAAFKPDAGAIVDIGDLGVQRAPTDDTPGAEQRSQSRRGRNRETTATS